MVYGASAWTDGRLNVVLRSKDGGRHWAFCKAGMVNATSPLDLLAFSHRRAGGILEQLHRARIREIQAWRPSAGSRAAT